MLETRAELPVAGDQVGLAQPGRPQRTCNRRTGTRCATVNCCAGGPAICGGSTGNTGVRNFAAGQLLGMSIPSGNLSNFQVTAASCGNQVTFTYAFDFIVG
jgi:hypothetical protein